jgi:hypothetical protein
VISKINLENFINITNYAREATERKSEGAYFPYYLRLAQGAVVI